MKLVFYLIVLTIIYFSYGLYLSQNDFSAVPTTYRQGQTSDFYDYRGVTNVRTDLSSGSSTTQEVIADAKRAGLDFLIITDTHLTDNTDTNNNYHGSLLVSVQGEHSLLDMRLLHYSAKPDLPPRGTNNQKVYFTDLLSQSSSQNKDSVVVLAHPFNNGATWTGTFPTGLDGIEVLNPKRVSQNAWTSNKLNVIWSLLCYTFNPNYAFLRLFQEPQEEISLWDKITATQKISGYSGADASARAIPFASYLMKFPSYHKSFEIASNHVLLQTELTGNYVKDRQKLFEAFKNGSFYFSMDLLGDPKGFQAYLLNDGEIKLMGSEVKLAKNQEIVIRLPSEPKYFYEIVLFKNGERETVTNNIELIYKVKTPGVYRAIVRVSTFFPIPDAKKWITWIYTNPFYIR